MGTRTEKTRGDTFKTAGRGRPSTRRLGDELAVMCALGRGADRLSLRALREYLCLDERQARELVDTLSCANPAGMPDGDGPLVPLYLVDDGMMGRLSTNGSRALGRLRLAESQADAVERAFDLLGISVDDELRERTAHSLYPLGRKPRPTGIAPLERGAAEGVLACARSIARARQEQDGSSVVQPVLCFTYRGANDPVIARTRRVVPRLIRIDQGRWLVDAFDLDARAARTFFASQMESCHCEGECASVPAGRVDRPDGGRVRLRCLGIARGVVQSWEGAQVVAEDGEALVVDVPYYRGEWLPRHVMALGSLVRHDSAELAREMAEVARADLERARALSGRATNATPR